MHFCQEITSVITGPGNKYILDITNGSGPLVRFKVPPDYTEQQYKQKDSQYRVQK